jgi:hypothetical protein
MGESQDDMNAAGSKPDAAPESGARCLSAADFERIATTMPSEIPAGIAAHLAACDACQARALSGDDKPRVRREAPSIWRMVAVLIAMLIATSTFAYLAYWMMG